MFSMFSSYIVNSSLQIAVSIALVVSMETLVGLGRRQRTSYEFPWKRSMRFTDEGLLIVLLQAKWKQQLTKMMPIKKITCKKLYGQVMNMEQVVHLLRHGISKNCSGQSFTPLVPYLLQFIVGT